DEEIAHAVADFGGPPVEHVRDEGPHDVDHVLADRSDRPGGDEPRPQPAMASEPEVARRPELPRRRSTVREPVPFMGGGSAAAPQQPPAPATATSAGETSLVDTSVVEVEPAAVAANPAATSDATSTSSPRRAGWWAKRMLGEKR